MLERSVMQHSFGPVPHVSLQCSPDFDATSDHAKNRARAKTARLVWLKLLLMSCSKDCVCVTVTADPAAHRRSRTSFSRTEARTVLLTASISDLRCVPSWTSRLCSAEIMKCSTSRHWLYTAGFVQHCCLVSLEMELYECKNTKSEPRFPLCYHQQQLAAPHTVTTSVSHR